MGRGKAWHSNPAPAGGVTAPAATLPLKPAGPAAKKRMKTVARGTADIGRAACRMTGSPARQDPVSCPRTGREADSEQPDQTQFFARRPSDQCRAGARVLGCTARGRPVAGDEPVRAGGVGGRRTRWHDAVGLCVTGPGAAGRSGSHRSRRDCGTGSLSGAAAVGVEIAHQPFREITFS